MKNKLLLGFLILSILLTACGKDKNNQNSNTKNNIKNEKNNTNIKVGIEKGNKIPDFTLINLLGGTEKFYDHKGKLILLNFWATWCPPCRQEMPSMEKLYQNKNGRNFEIIAISLDKKPTKDVEDFIANHNYNFPVYHDTKNELGRKFLIQSIPQTFIVDQDGIIIDKITGAFDWTKIDVDTLIKEGD